MAKNIIAGRLNQKILNLVSCNLNAGDIYVSSGLPIHLINHNHSDCIKYIPLLKDIIKNPDYVGVSPRNTSSLELVKVLDGNVLVAIKLDTSNNYLYVASIYKLQQKKLISKINSGRLVPNN